MATRSRIDGLHTTATEPEEKEAEVRSRLAWEDDHGEELGLQAPGAA